MELAAAALEATVGAVAAAAAKAGMVGSGETVVEAAKRVGMRAAAMGCRKHR